MKQKIKKFIKYLPYSLLLFPALASAEDNFHSGLGSIKGLFAGSGLASATDLTSLITSVIRLMLLFAGVIAVVFIIIGGYQYLTSAGNDEAAEKGKKTLLNAVIGVVVIILSYAIISVISNLITGPGGYYGSSPVLY